MPGYWTPAIVGVAKVEAAVTESKNAETDGPNCTAADEEEVVAEADDIRLCELPWGCIDGNDAVGLEEAGLDDPGPC